MRATTWMGLLSAALLLACAQPDSGTTPAAREPARAEPARTAPADEPARTAPAAVDAFAHMDRVLAHQKKMVAALEGIKTLADVKRIMPTWVKATVVAFKMQIEALKLALALDDARFKAYAAKAEKLKRDNAALARKMIRLQQGFLKIEGVKKLVVQMQAQVNAKLGPLLAEYSELGKKFMVRKAGLGGAGKTEPKPNR